MAKSYFAILGVTSNASPNEIRSAYRQLAKAFHPDHFEGGSGDVQGDSGSVFCFGEYPKAQGIRTVTRKVADKKAGKKHGQPGA